MGLEEFLKILFDKETDKYPGIREAVLCGLSVSDARNIYNAFRFMPSRTERLRCIGYTYFDHGITISCDIMGYNIYPVHNTVYSKGDMVKAINTTVSKWVNALGISTIPIIDPEITACMSISSENIEFFSGMSLFISKLGVARPYKIFISTKHIRKFDGRVIVTKHILNKPTVYVYNIFEKLNVFCGSLCLPILEEKLIFETTSYT
jgi:hypothetical protein